MLQTPQTPPDLVLDRGEFLPVLALCALEIPLARVQALAGEADALGCSLAELVRCKLATDEKPKRKGGDGHEKATLRDLAG
jgi:hypothetical protein